MLQFSSVCLLLFSLTLSVMTVKAQTLDTYRWKHRLLLIFTPDLQHPTFQAQSQSFFAVPAALAERDLLLFVITPQQTFLDKKPLPSLAAGDLRSAYRIAPDAYSCILIGKDGGEKRRETSVISSADWFSTIDAMPMRRQEMQSKRP